MVEVLVEAAEKSVSPDVMQPVVAAMRDAPAAALTAPETLDAVPAALPGTGFVDRFWRDADGTESRYVVFIPPTYDGSQPVPAILYLHGSGPRGTDGKAHLEHGLAPAIRAKDLQFPFLVIFPQAREGEDWSAGTPGGTRALRILADTQANYRIDAKRIALTGVSMGGAGTWSLAAAQPERWSALVPLSHGGDTASAAKLVEIPCWCFHGASDQMIPPQQSRDMIEAITSAGGHPLYEELPEVGHNDCADRVYMKNDLYEWLLLQDRSKR